MAAKPFTLSAQEIRDILLHLDASAEIFDKYRPQTAMEFSMRAMLGTLSKELVSELSAREKEEQKGLPGS
jgi:hypothetical protein